MLSADLRYNPYFQSAEIFIAGKIRTSGRLGAFINGQPMSEWLDAYSKGYRRWDGLLPELITDLNEDELSLRFMGLAEDCNKFREALLRQKSLVQRLGYDPSAWTLENVPAFLPEKIIPVILMLVRSLIPHTPSQNALIVFEALVEEDNPFTVNRVKELYTRLSSAIEKATSYCREISPEKVRRWEQSQRDLSAIITKGGF